MNVRESRRPATRRLWEKAVLICLGLMLVLFSGSVTASESGGSDGVIALRAVSRPVIDGDLSDACWTGAVLVEDFTLPDTDVAPTEPMGFRICFDDSALYCAFTCVEPSPQLLRLGEPSVPHTVWFEPEQQWRMLTVPFATGPDGQAEIIIGSTESSGKGMVELRKLTLVQTGRLEMAGPPISVPADGKRVVVTEVPVADSRVVRGFVGTPFDGTQRSRSWSGRIWEYPMPGGGAGVGYAYRNNDGLHVRLADSLGFDVIQVRGGIRANCLEMAWMAGR